MANLNIAINIAAQDKASGPIGRIQGAVKGLAGSAKAGFAQVQSLITTGIVGAAGLGVTAILGIGAAGFSVANDVQSATQQIEGFLGGTAEESERLAEIAGQVWGNNFAGDISEAAGAVGLVRQQLGDLADNELKRATENAFRLSDNFDSDVAESITAADVLMEKFGLTSDEAFDFITGGMQAGLNGSGDFLESIREYSGQFADGGADAGQFFAVMQTGFQNGVLGTDKAADLFKEFHLRIQDGSSAVAEALDSIGLSSADMSAQMADGSLTSIDALQMVKTALSNIDDENLQFQAGVALMGSQFEDLGVNAALGLEFIDTALEDVTASTASLDAKYKTLPDTIEGFKRRGLLALKPIGETLLSFTNQIMPFVEQGFSYFEVTLVPIIERVANAFGGFFEDLQSGSGFIAAFSTLAADGFGATDTQVTNLINNAVILGDWFTANVQPIVDMAAGFLTWQDVLIAVGVVIAATVIPALVSIVVTAAPILLAIGALVGGVALLRNAWQQNWGDIQGKTAAAWDFIKPLFDIAHLWLSIQLPIALDTLRGVWVDTVLPAIQAATSFWWENNKTTFNILIGFVKNNIIPTVQNLATTWGARFRTMQAVLQNVWTVISSVWAELGRWINDNIVPWVNFLSEVWAEKWGAIEAKLSTAWAIIEPIWSSFRDWMQNKIPPALDGLSSRFSTVMGAISSAISPVKTLWDNLVAAVKGFFNWLSNRTFSFKINIPDLPDWAIPGSPIPLHTAWKDFANDIGGRVIRPRFDTSGVLPGATTLQTGAAAGGSLGGGLTIVFQPGAVQVVGSGGSTTGNLKSAIEQAVREAMNKSGRRADQLIRSR